MRKCQAVQCSDLVRRRALHTQKFPLKSVRTRREARPCYGTRNDNREPRQTHEKKIRAPLESNHKTLCGLCASVVKNNHRDHGERPDVPDAAERPSSPTAEP